MTKEGIILGLLKKNPMTIDNVSKNLKMSRITASKYLAVMEAKKMIAHEEVGRAKLYSVRKK